MFDTLGVIAGNFDAASGTLMLSGSDTAAAYELALRSVLFSNTSDNPSSARRTVAFSVSDGDLSSVTMIRYIDVVSVDDSPILENIPSTALAYIENSPAMLLFDAVTISDSDSSLLTGATISIPDGYQSGEDVLSVTANPAVEGSFDAGSGTLTLTKLATLADYQEALRSIRYYNTSDTPNTATRTVSLVVSYNSTRSATTTRTVTIQATNDAPSLGSMELAPFVYTEKSQPAALTANVTVADSDNANLSGAIVRISSNYQMAQDRLAEINLFPIVGTFNLAAGTLTLSGSDSLANYQAALRSVRYYNTSDSPTTVARTMTFTVTDGENESASVMRALQVQAVNNAPVLASIETTALAYVQNDAPRSLTQTLSISDVDNTSLSGATVAIVENYQLGEDHLLFTDAFPIVGAFDEQEGTLTLSGVDSLANYREALRSITYYNTSATPIAVPRAVSFVVTDGKDPSAPMMRSIAIILNNSPVIGTIEPTSVNYVEDAEAIALAAGITVTDSDSTELVGASIQFTRNYLSNQDRLQFVDAPPIVSAGFDVQTGTLSLSGRDTIANYQAALRLVLYDNLRDNPSTQDRTVSFVVDDGVGRSLPASVFVNINASNDRPVVLAAEPVLVSYTENDAALAVGSGLSVADIDSVNLYSAVVLFAAESYHLGEDLLDAAVAPPLESLFDVDNGMLTIRNVDTVANYQIALNSVRYTNASDAPSTQQRTLQVIVDDGSLSSQPATMTFGVTAVNDAPMNVVPEAQIISEDESLTFSAAGATLVAVNDPDAGVDNVLRVTLVATHGTLTLADATHPSLMFAAGDGVHDAVMTFGATMPLINDVLDGLLFEAEPGFDGTGSVEIVISDQGASGSGGPKSDTDSVEITILPALAPTSPVLSGVEADTLRYVENNPAIAVTDKIIVRHAYSAMLSSARITLFDEQSVLSENELLFFDGNVLPSLSSEWDDAAGTLTLTGVDTVINYQIALRAVSYVTTSDDPSETIRTVRFVVSDGVADSNVVQRTVAVLAVNDPPVCVLPGQLVGNEDSPLRLSAESGTRLAISDPDAKSSSLQTTLTALNGIVSLSRTDGLVFTLGTGTEDPNMSFAGTLAATNAALEGLVFTPSGNYSGSAGVQILTNDHGASGVGGARAGMGLALINILPVNDAPVTSDDAYAVDENGGLTVAAQEGVLANDADPEGQMVVATLETEPAHGSLTLEPSGAFSYTPALDYVGPDAFTYKAYDGNNASRSTTVVIAVEPGLDTPVDGGEAEGDLSNPMEAVITASPTAGPVALTVELSGANSRGRDGAAIVEYKWDFTDGTILTSSSPVVRYVFVQPGGVTVTMQVRDAARNFAQNKTTIFAQEGKNWPPKGFIVANVDSGPPGMTVHFSADAFDVDGTISSYLWQVAQDVTSDSETFDYTFDEVGTYRVRLMVEDNSGLRGVDSQLIEVREPDGLPPPRVRILMTADSGASHDAPVTVVFGIDAEVLSGGKIKTREWTFFEKRPETEEVVVTTSDEENVTRTFTDPGFVVIQLRVTDDHDLAGSDAQTFYVTRDEQYPPRIVSKGSTRAVVGQAYHYDMDDTVAAQGKYLSWSLGREIGGNQIDVPPSMWIHPDTGRITWTPPEELFADEDEALVVEESVVVRVKNGVDLKDWQKFTITVARSGNSPPVAWLEPAAESSGCACSASTDAQTAMTGMVAFALVLGLFVSLRARQKHRGTGRPSHFLRA